MSKKFLGYVLGGLMALAIAAPALLGGHAVHAQALGEDDFFGGEITGEEFAGAAGLNSNADLPETIGAIIRIALGFLGILATCIILIGGFKWMTAGGHDEKVKSAKKVMVSGVIGLVIVLSAFAIAQFAIRSIITATS